MKFNYFQHQPTNNHHTSFLHDLNNSTVVPFLHDFDNESPCTIGSRSFIILLILKIPCNKNIYLIYEYSLTDTVGDYSNGSMGTIRSNLQIGLYLVSAIVISLGAMHIAKFITEENNFRITIGSVVLDLTAICRTIWTSAFALNLITVSLPGRFDSISAQEAQMKKLKAVSSEDAKKIEVTMPWTTFFEPSPWAFAIWGVIYFTELLLTGFVLCLGNIQKSVVETATAYWVAGNVFQSVWCFCFRPEFRQSLWLPMVFLGLSSCSFFKAHQEITVLIGSSSASLLQKFGLYLFRFPFSLHASM